MSSSPVLKFLSLRIRALPAAWIKISRHIVSNIDLWSYSYWMRAEGKLHKYIAILLHVACVINVWDRG
jgi:hypothetical protein